jgi:2-methylisocitrate lyase-like PEP mutase family enzyme
MPNNATLRDLIKPGKMLVAPGAYDCITARLIEQAGYPVVYMTGAGTSISLGYPDFGLVTMTEMVANAGRLAASINVPLISDSDTGYGNELNMYRTAQEFERAGVAAIHIEDQVFPKKCGHLDDKELVSLEDYLAKIRAAVAARRNPDFLIIARTDSRAKLGLEEAVRRSNAAIAAGADIAFVEAPQTMAEVEQVPKLVKGPCLLNVVRNGKTPEIDLSAAERMGYAITILPGLLMSGVVGICDQLLAETKKIKRHPPTPGDAGPAQIFARFGAAEWDSRRSAFRTGISATTRAAAE